MFDIGLMEIGLILLVALFAIGPERMPEVARMLVRLKRFLGQLRGNMHALWDGLELPPTSQHPTTSTLPKNTPSQKHVEHNGEIHDKK